MGSNPPIIFGCDLLSTFAEINRIHLLEGLFQGSEKGKVIKFTTQYELLINDQWHPVIRYDTAHNFVHIDILYPDDAKTKKELSFSNYNEALTYSILDLNTNWKRYKNQFLRRLKNEKG